MSSTDLLSWDEFGCAAYPRLVIPIIFLGDATERTPPVRRASVTDWSSTVPPRGFICLRCGLLDARPRPPAVLLTGIFDKGARMRKILHVSAIVLFVVPISLTLGAQQAAAQGPAGSGAAAAAQD